MKLLIRLTLLTLVLAILALPMACDGTPAEPPSTTETPVPTAETPTSTTPTTATPTVEPTKEPDFNVIETELLGQAVSFHVGRNTAIWEDVSAVSPDGKYSLSLLWGTELSDADGKALDSFAASLGEPPSTPAEGSLIGPAITFTPAVVSANPGITLTCNVSGYLDPLGGVPEKDLCFAAYSAAGDNWTGQPTSVNPVTHGVTLILTELTGDNTFAIYALKAPEPEVTEPSQAIPLEWISITPPSSKPGDQITVTILTTPGATCDLTFINPPYSPTQPRTRSAQKPPVQTADENGLATFVWKTSTHAHAGDADLEVVLTLGDDKATYLHPYTLQE